MVNSRKKSEKNRDKSFLDFKGGINTPGVLCKKLIFLQIKISN